MESMVMHGLFEGEYAGKRVLLTGHTGFKGSWLLLWLQQMGAQVCAVALPPATTPSLYSALRPALAPFEEHLLDINDGPAVREVVTRFQPDIVFHLAAQAIVLEGYQDPVGTFATNVMGTLHLLVAAQACPSVKAFVNITSDKCYENKEWPHAYREADPMGGHDPYSASKGCAELLTSSFRRSFCAKEGMLLASTRAGNVVGGGDWAPHRIVPDLMRAAASGQPVDIRNPLATRPWQHVLEPLSGYLWLGARLLQGRRDLAMGWNFGPMEDAVVPVKTLALQLQAAWPAVCYQLRPELAQYHEANLLMLDHTQARLLLAWQPVWHLAQNLAFTARWYAAFYAGQPAAAITLADLQAYVQAARALGLPWALPHTPS